MLKQKFLFDFGTKFLTYLITALTGLVVARLAGPETVGAIAYATAYVTTFSFIMSFLGTSHIKLVSEGENQDDCNKTFLILSLASIFLYVLIVSGFMLFQKHALGYNYRYTNMELILIITFISYVISQIFQINESYYNARIEQVKSNVPTFVRNLVFNILRVIVVIMGMGAVALSFTNLISALITLPIAIYYIKKLKFGKWNIRIAKRYLKIGIPVFILLIIGVIMAYSDKIILEYFASVKDVGYYSAAYSIAGMLIMIGNSAGTVFFPLFSSLISEKKITEIEDKIWTFEKFVLVFCVPFIILLVIYSYPIIIFLLGSKYEPSVILFSILAFSALFAIFSLPYGNIISGLGMFWTSALITFFKFLLFCVFMIFCISPKFLNLGALALALTFLVTNVFQFVIYYYIAHKKLKINLLKKQLKYLIFWIIMLPVNYFFYIKFLHFNSIYVQNFIFMPINLLVIYILYRIFRLFDKSDIITLKSTFNFKNNRNYIIQEIRNK